MPRASIAVMSSKFFLRSLGLLCFFTVCVLVAPACVGDGPTVAATDAGGATPDGASGGPKKMGDSCAAGDTCIGSVCADGFCCDSACTDTCGACNMKGHEGTCAPVTGMPVGKRVCKGSATGACAGACDGTLTTDCAYPKTSCGTDACTAGSSTAGTCSMGACSTKMASCADNLCGASACATVTQVVMGVDFACALLSDGTVRCWGDNSHGQLGQGPTDVTARLVPTPVQGLSGAVASIGAGDSHACAIMKKDGAVLCWGSNADHQLGLGEAIPGTADNGAHGVPTPVCMAGSGSTVCKPLIAATKVVGTDTATCATFAGVGAPKCWGDGGFGRVTGYDSAGTVPPTANPVPVCGGLSSSTVMDIAMGQNTACAVDSTGFVFCWGDNNLGKAGQATTISQVHCATQNSMTAITNAKKVAISAYAACALTTGGSVMCWGAGQARGNGTTNNDSNQVTTVTPPMDAVGIAGGGSGNGGNTFCAAISDGTAKCWGANVNGEIGDGSVTLGSITVGPNTVVSIPGKVVDVAGASSGYDFCALLGDQGVLRCWGYSRSGSLGNGSTLVGVQSTPVAQKW
jgi:alpha-tubulin suppressor-like RCC1 family protein